MIARFPGPGRTRGRAVVHDGLVFTVANTTDRSQTMYEQTRESLAMIDRHLSEAGSDKSRILQATVYIADVSQKPEMNRAWDEWVDRNNPPVRACIGVTLETGDLVEIVVVAAVR